jgi:hypothetical protein
VAGGVNALVILVLAFQTAADVVKVVSVITAAMMRGPEQRLRYLVNGVRVAERLIQIRTLFQLGGAFLNSWL